MNDWPLCNLIKWTLPLTKNIWILVKIEDWTAKWSPIKCALTHKSVNTSKQQVFYSWLMFFIIIVLDFLCRHIYCVLCCKTFTNIMAKSQKQQIIIKQESLMTTKYICNITVMVFGIFSGIFFPFKGNVWMCRLSVTDLIKEVPQHCQLTLFSFFVLRPVADICWHTWGVAPAISSCLSWCHGHISLITLHLRPMMASAVSCNLLLHCLKETNIHKKELPLWCKTLAASPQETLLNLHYKVSPLLTVIKPVAISGHGWNGRPWFSCIAAR